MTNAPASNGTDDKLVMVGDTPKVRDLIDDFKTCSPWADNTWNRVTDNENTRFMRWPNQYPDGKKHDSSRAKAFPFDGASDVRIPLADSVVNENVAVCCAAFWRANLSPKMGVSEGSDYALKLADYYINTKLFHEFFREVELSEQYRQTIGWTALHPTWVREISLYRREVTLEQLVNLAQSMPGTPFEQLPELIKDPSQDGQTVEVLGQLYEMFAKVQVEQATDVKIPPLAPAKIRKAIVELREDGKTELPLPCVVKNQPEVVALKPYDEIFLPQTATDVQLSQRVYRRFWMSEFDLRSRELTHNWNRQWVTEALKHKGEYSTWAVLQTPLTPPEQLSDAMNLASSSWTMTRQNEKLVEVIYCFYRALDADNVPGVYMTVIHPMVCNDPLDSKKVLYAEHGLVEAPQGQYPFVTGQRENWSRVIVQSRGVPQVVQTWQREVKVQRDALVDHTSMAVTPPVLIPKGTMGTKLKFGPATQNEVTPGREPRFMEIPMTGTPLALQLIELVENETDNYFGRMSADVPPSRVQVKQQMLVQPFLLMWGRAIQQMLMLAQCYMPDQEFSTVTGAPPGWLEQRRNAYGILDVELQFDVRELDPEFAMKQMETVNNVIIPGDAGGVIDRTKNTQMQMRSLSPFMAKQLVSDQQTATQQIFRQVKQDIALMYLGNEPEYVKMDATAQTKLQYAQQIIQANPNYSQALQGKGRFAELMEKYVANLQFSITEQQNKQVGAIGVKPDQAGLGTNMGNGTGQPAQR